MPESGAAGALLHRGVDGNAAPDVSSIGVDDTVKLYLAEAGQVPLLTREQEVELAKAFERGREAQARLTAEDGLRGEEWARLQRMVAAGEGARQHLIKANTRLVVSIAKQYKGYALPFSDLIQAGNVGLIKAIDKFDYRQGTRISTYATWWIRQAILRTMNNHGRTIRIPVYVRHQISRLKRVERRLEQGLGHRPSPEEIAEELHMKPSRVRRLLQISQPAASLDRLVGEEDAMLRDFVEDESVPSPTDRVEQHMLREAVQEVLETLSPREASVLRLRFGLDDGRSRTLSELAERLNVTRERVRQIQSRALRKLRHCGGSRRLRDYVLPGPNLAGRSVPQRESPRRAVGLRRSGSQALRRDTAAGRFGAVGGSRPRER
jgi:RNA polymerase primary sigma factor